jgi:hypothetical protein
MAGMVVVRRHKGKQDSLSVVNGSGGVITKESTFSYPVDCCSESPLPASQDTFWIYGKK